MFRRTALLVDRFRVPLLIGVILISVVAAWSATGIEYDFRPQALFAGSDSLVNYSEEVRQTFGYEDAVLLILAEAVGEADVLDRRLLSWQGRVANRIRQLPSVKRVDAVVRMLHPRPRLRPPWFIASPLVRDLPVDESTERRVRAVVDGSRLVDGALIDRARKLGVIAVTVNQEGRRIGPMKTVMLNVSNVVNGDPVPKGYRVHLTGLPAIRVDIVAEMQRDQQTLLPVAAALFLIVLAVLFRQVAAAVLPLSAVGIGLVWTIGLLAAGGQGFNLLSNALPLLLLVLGVSNSVHIVSRFLDERTASRSARRAARRTLEHVGGACFLASLTTAIGFWSIALARSEVLQDFGWQAAVGMAALFFSTLLVLGATLPLLSRKRGPEENPLAEPELDEAPVASPRLTPAARSMEWAVFGTIRHPWITLVCSAALIAASLWVGRNVAVNSYLIETFDSHHPTLKSLRLVEDQLAGVIALEVNLNADRPERFLEPRNFAAIARVQDFGRELPAVTQSRSYVDLFQETYRKIRKSDKRRDELPTLDERGRKRIELSQRFVERFAEALDLPAFLTEDGGRARIVFRLRDVGSKKTLKVIRALESKLREAFPPESGIAYRMTGDAYVSAIAMDRFIRDIFSSFGVAALVIFAVIAVLFRSLRLGLVAALPNMTPMAITLGYMGLRGYEMNAGNAIVFSVSLGIAVDDTIHFLARFREERSRTDDITEAITATLRHTGKAIVLTTVLIISGLSVLMFSEFVPSRRIAELISVAMAAALIGDLLLLPACLQLFTPASPTRTARTSSPPPNRPPESARA